MATKKRPISYNGMNVSVDESQTIGNCIDLGFSTLKTKKIIKLMRKEKKGYLSRKALEKYRDLK